MAPAHFKIFIFKSEKDGKSPAVSICVSDRQRDREVQRTDRGANDAEELSDVMPFGRETPPAPPAFMGRLRLRMGLGKQGRGL